MAGLTAPMGEAAPQASLQESQVSASEAGSATQANTAPALLSGATPPPQGGGNGRDSRRIQGFAQLPMSFIPNAGQTDAAVRFQVRGRRGQLFFTPEEIVMSLPLTDTVAPAAGLGAIRADQATRAASPRPRSLMRVRFDGAEPSPEIVSGDPLPGVANVINGDQPQQWQTGLPTFAGIRYHNLYPGIDLQYNGTDGALKSTFTVAPGANPSQIEWHYTGAGKPQLDSAGNLVLTVPVSVTQALTTGLALADEAQSGVPDEMAAGAAPPTAGSPDVAAPTAGQATKALTIVEQTPVAWQELDGVYQPVEARFNVAQNGRVSFVLGAYDPQLPLIIDPVLSYGSYLGGSLEEMGLAIDVDAAGNSYVAGYTDSADFPGAAGPKPGGRDGFVAKLNPAGSALVYSTYIGGGGADEFHDIALDAAGQAWLAGYSESGGSVTPGFPISAGAAQTTYRGSGDGVLVRLTANGAFAYGTFLGGTSVDEATAIALTSGGNAYITGYTYSGDLLSVNPPTTPGLQQTCGSCAASLTDGFVLKLNTAGTGWDFRTFLGGSGPDGGWELATDSSNAVIVAGQTSSAAFLPAPLYPYGGGASDGFVAKLNSAGTSYSSTTYLGGSGDDTLYALALDSAGNAYVAGTSNSTNYPAEPPPSYQSWNRGGFDAIISVLNASGTALTFSSYLGGSADEVAYGLAVDPANGTVIVTGKTQSTDFPQRDAFQVGNGGGDDAFVSRLKVQGYEYRPELVSSTYLGGAANDVGSQVVADRVNANVAYVVGLTSSANLPLANPRQSSNGGGQDSFVAKLVEQVSSATTAEQQTTTYSYDGLQRLVGAVESPGNSYAYAYDLVGNRTDAFRNGTLVERRSYDAADRVLGWTYDEVGNLLSDARSHTFEYDSLNRLIRRGPWEYAYNGDGLRVVEASPTLPAPTSIVTTWDLAAPLPEALRRERIAYSPWVSYALYGQERLLQLDGGIQTWYGADGLGSTRRTLNSAGNALSSQWYDPWGLPRNVPLATAFGFTGARQTSDGFTYLRAREYLAGYGLFSARDSFAGFPEQPYSLHLYQYSYANPVLRTDPSGLCVAYNNNECALVRTWGELEDMFPFACPRNSI